LLNEDEKIQRDLYSAFLLMNANEAATKPNRELCNETFSLFKSLHDQEIQHIVKQRKIILNSGIIVRTI
jgi:hypothetical protein